MSKPAKVGGIVQISGKRYEVNERLGREDGFYLITVLSEEDGRMYTARSEDWRGGCGPWKINGAR